MAGGRLIDRSGTITTGGVSQIVAQVNVSRVLFFFQNVSPGDLWVNFDAAATLTQPSIKVIAGGSLSAEEGYVPSGPVYVIGATTGQAFTAKEG